MKNKKITIIASAALVLVICIAAVVFVAEFKKDDLPDCTYKITNKQREMSTYDLLKWFCETDYMKKLDPEYTNYIYSSEFIDPSDLTPCNDHQAYYELIRRDDLKDAFWQLESADDERPQALLVFVFQEEVQELFAD